MTNRKLYALCLIQIFLFFQSAIAQESSNSSTAYSDCHEAEDQANRAHEAAERARHATEKGLRQDDASEAYRAAAAAREACNRAYQASSDGDAATIEYAHKAREAADRAHADAEQARYFADTVN